ncbi:hypothetical protein FQA47_019473 [Oryzias melastigma]|uniref:Uncharacterized protein n=1 Tax=Oryzias melastigma TaxID=30732 RepID=A0A834C6P6_ORYME|nr:hypothetical protein FQA47_019473 [Oryzias melastigma]
MRRTRPFQPLDLRLSIKGSTFSSGGVHGRTDRVTRSCSGTGASPGRMPYEEVLSLENLQEVRNPWKGFSMTRCLVLTLAVLLLSSGINELHDAVDALVEDSGIRSLSGGLQTVSAAQTSMWDSLMWWWRSEDVGAIRRRKKPLGDRVILKPKSKE